MFAVFGTLSVIPWILFAQASWNPAPAPAVDVGSSGQAVDVEVRDRGELFGPGAGRRAREALQGIDRVHPARVLIEAIPSLDGAWIADVALRRAKDAAPDRLYVLVAGEEREVGVVAGRRGPASRLTDRQREQIRQAFLGPLRAGHPDEAFDRGILEIRATLDRAAAGTGAGAPAVLLFATTVLAVLLASWAREKLGGGERTREGGGACREHARDAPRRGYRGAGSPRKVGV
ncbi:hypothetical protein OJF2_32620 [Aquisphaera giovannonii]|uniref:TPM domain-containing protein n=1 Tax=Aquisphaera giovannonii TaxID=406548 RepID=A0A5B9W430_9BACT|nr:TPM domain-containing protein [Aquisphaera giovannonii]QEH34720.1 hypothetical protein OJF2_32620 [Aquisphaera giovannonii]